MSPFLSRPRRRSPSVITPTSCAFASTTPVTPRRFEVISNSASFHGVSSRTNGNRIAAIHQVFDSQHSLRPRHAAGMAHGEILLP